MTLDQSEKFPREIEVIDREAGRYFAFLETFFGTKSLHTKLTKVNSELKQERGAYLHYYVLPKNAFWLGIQEGRKYIDVRAPFAGSLTPNMELCLELAAKLIALKDSMPEEKIDEFRKRLLGEDIISPVLFELNIASHFWQMGFEIEWLLPSKITGKKSAEFRAVKPDQTIEVECKTKMPDSGRKIRRRNFYRLVDLIREILTGYTGTLKIKVPNQLSIDRSSQYKIRNTVLAHLQNPSISLYLDDGIQIEINLKRSEELSFTAREIASKIEEIRKPYSQIAVLFSKRGSAYINPLIICIDSELEDKFLHDIFESLREANRQFSLKHPGLICCFVPEVEDFSGLTSGSALGNMTHYFFDKHSRDCIFAISYISDTQRDEFGIYISKSMPSITFMNPNYNTNLGNVTSVYRI